jgi:hypothetical protein
MNAALLTAFQTEPWSLVLLGATLFALSAFAKRRTAVAPALASVPTGIDVAVAAAPAAVLVAHRGALEVAA